MKNVTKIALFVLLIISMIGCTEAATVHVGPGASYGSYAVDGVDDHVQINAALAAAGNGGTVYLHSYTYRITRTVYIPTGVTLTGDSTVVVQAASNYFNTEPRALIQQANSGESNVVIHGFKIDGNRDEIGGSVGKGYENLIYLIGVDGVTIYDMQYYDSNSDCMKFSSCSDIEIYNCKVTKSGHEGVYASNSDGIRVHDCTMDINTNCGIRFYNCDNAEGDHNTIYCTTGSGASAFELDHYGDGTSMNNKIHHNVIYNTPHWGIWVFSRADTDASSNYANIYNNIVYDCDSHTDHNGRGGISVQCWNALIENNIVDGNNINGVYIGSNFGSDSSGSGYSVTLRHNIVSNTDGSYAVNCGQPAKYIVTLDTNNLYNPSTVTGVDSNTGTLTSDPQYSNAGSHSYIPLSASSPMYRFYSDWSSYTGGTPGGVPGGSGSDDETSGTGGGGETSGEPLPVYNGSTAVATQQPYSGQTVSSVDGCVSLYWSNVNSTSYNVLVANNSDFAEVNILHNVTATDTSTCLALDLGTYYWKVRAYDDTNAHWENYTTAVSFTVGENQADTGGIVSGRVYDSTSGKGIKGAVVTLVSNEQNWSATYTTDTLTDTGSYTISAPYAGSYTLFAAAKDYQSTITGMPVTLDGSSAGQDIALAPAQSYFAPNYVTYTVMSILGVRYSGVTVTAYDASFGVDPLTASDPETQGITDENGQVTLKLDEQKTYQLNVTDETQNISASFVRAGTGGIPYLVVWGATKTNVNPEIPNMTTAEDYIAYGIDTSELNLSYGYINQTIRSRDAQTLNFSTTIRSVNVTGQTDGLFQYLSSGSGDINITVMAPRNATYYVNTTVTHPIGGSKTYSRLVELRASEIRDGLDLGFDEQWQYSLLGIILMFLFGGLFGRRSQGVGALMLALIGCFCMWAGWFAYDLTQEIMAMFAILLVFVYLIRRE